MDNTSEGAGASQRVESVEEINNKRISNILMYLTCYSHQRSLIVRGEDGPDDAFSKDGDSDGDGDGNPSYHSGRENWARISERVGGREGGDGVYKKIRDR